MQVFGSASTLGSMWSNTSQKTRSVLAVPDPMQTTSLSISTQPGQTLLSFSNMSVGQMDNERKDLATSGKITMTQNLMLYGMEGLTPDGQPVVQSAGASQSYDWYDKLNQSIAEAKKTGGPTEKTIVAADQGLIDTFKGLEA